MNDTEYEAQEERIKHFIDRWLGRLGLHWLRSVEIVSHRDGTTFAAHGHGGAAGLTHVWWGYKDAKVEFDLSKTAEMGAADLEYVVVHELMHIFLQQVVTAFADGDEITNIQGQHVERTATELAQAFVWVRDFAASGEMSDAPEAA